MMFTTMLCSSRARVRVYLSIVLDLTFLTRTNARLEFRPKTADVCRAHRRIYSRTRRANAEIKTRWCSSRRDDVFAEETKSIDFSHAHAHIFNEINRFIYQSFYRECTRPNKTSFDYVDVLLTD